MTSLQIPIRSSFSQKRVRAYAAISATELARVPVSIPKIPTSSSSSSSTKLVHKFNGSIQALVPSQKDATTISQQTFHPNKSKATIIQLYAILETVADRIKMHKNICEQRSIWNFLLLVSINMMNLAASTMVALNTAIHNAALKPLSTLLFTAAKGMLLIMNKFQPSQLAEEQQNATSLFKQLHTEIQTKLTLGNSTQEDVNSAMERVLTLDKAYPSKFEPAAWWPKTKANEQKMKVSDLEKEMKENIEVERRKDMEDYERLRNWALNINEILAISGPLLTGIAASGSAFVSRGSSWLAIVAAMARSFATSINALERVGQVGMVYESYRNCGGFFNLLQEIIKAKHGMKDDSDTKKTTTQHGMKMAMELGRNVKINLMIGF